MTFDLEVPRALDRRALEDGGEDEDGPDGEDEEGKNNERAADGWGGEESVVGADDG